MGSDMVSHMGSILPLLVKVEDPQLVELDFQLAATPSLTCLTFIVALNS
jgi:hypothetical protein